MKATFLSILFLLVLVSCDNKESVCPDNETFCSIVEAAGDLNDLREVTNGFMSTLSGDSDAQLEQVRVWFECKTCVDKAKLLCNSCIETFPEQSELEIKFISNGQEETKTLDITMLSPMVFGEFH